MRTLALGNDWEFVRDMKEFSTVTGQPEPKTGLTLTGFFSRTKNGAAIDPTLSKSLIETSVVGRYAAPCQGSDITTYLTPVLGTLQAVVIYDRCTGTGYSDYEEVTLVAARRAGA